MKIIYKGTDITKSVDIHRCIHDMYAAGHADTLHVMIDDEKMNWDAWQAATDDEIKIVSDDVETGTMFIKKISFCDGFIHLLACSVPTAAFSKKDKTWKNITITRLVKDIAKQNGLKIKLYGIEERKYSFLQQEKESDVSLLNRLCILEGYAFLVFNKTLIVYSEPEMEAVKPVKTITLGNRDEFQTNQKIEYGSCAVTCGAYSGEYKAGAGPVYMEDVKTCADGKADTNRYAKNILRQKNKMAASGSKQIEGIDKGIVPASVINIKSEQAKSWNGSAFVYRVRNDYIHKNSKLFFRKPLKGY